MLSTNPFFKLFYILVNKVYNAFPPLEQCSLEFFDPSQSYHGGKVQLSRPKAISKYSKINNSKHIESQDKNIRIWALGSGAISKSKLHSFPKLTENLPMH